MSALAIRTLEKVCNQNGLCIFLNKLTLSWIELLTWFSFSMVLHICIFYNSVIHIVGGGISGLTLAAALDP